MLTGKNGHDHEDASSMRRILFYIFATAAIIAACLWLGGTQRWAQIASAIAFLTLLGFQGIFQRDLEETLHRPEMHMDIEKSLMDEQPSAWWIRGRIRNTGDLAGKACRVKLLSVSGDGVKPRSINGVTLQWRGGDPSNATIVPDEDLIFDIGTIGKGFVELKLFGQSGNVRVEESFEVPALTLELALYGENFRALRKKVRLRREINIGVFFE
jgi:hypothetical protein